MYTFSYKGDIILVVYSHGNDSNKQTSEAYEMFNNIEDDQPITR